MIQVSGSDSAANSPPAAAGFVAAYETQFHIVPADSQGLLKEAHRLRYQVYCVENAFENPVEHPGGYERDAEDDRSAHILLVHRRSGAFAGTARVILPAADGTGRPLPVHRILASQDLDFSRCLPLHSTAEISRFAISKAFRRWSGVERHAVVAPRDGRERASDERRMTPYMTFGLIRGVLEICKKHRIAHLGAMTEPALMRIMGRFGVNFRPIGDLVEHHGLRRVCCAQLADAVRRDTLLGLYTGYSAALAVAA
jgi:N-acyl amino acid synthase of PEP-CTERM/exosortase system